MKFEAEETRVSTKKSTEVEAPKEASLVQIYGPDLGRRYSLRKFETTIGRDEKNDLVLDNDNVSRSHARLITDGTEVRFEDLGSTNGSLVNDEEVDACTLHSGDLIKIGSVMLKFLSGGSAESLYHEEIYRLTIRDGLTDISNRRYFEDFLEREVARSMRYERPLSLMIFDIDHFKRVNDEFGHLAGDYVLRRMAGVLQIKVRREELLARYGGEEFVVVMPETGIEKATLFGEKIRALVESTEFDFDDRKIAITVSVGVALLQGSMATRDFVKAADKALYQAKQQGRNRVCTA